MMKLRPAAVLASYFAPGYVFRKIGSADCSRPVFLIHGWGVRAISMAGLGYALARQGYTVFNFDYPTAENSIAGHTVRFLDLFRRLLQEEKITGQVRFVTHSMGGLILRGALAQMTETECRRIAAAVMLGPPNRGSFWGKFGRSALIRRLNASLGDMAPEPEAYVMKIPAPLFLPPVGIIAGRYDAKVFFRNTALPDGQAFKRTTVSCTHPGLRDPRNTLPEILHFLEEKKFSDG